MIKKIIAIPAALLAMCAALSGASQQWTSGGLGQVLAADGSTLPASFTFQIGSFGSFSPTADNFADWSSNFNTAGLEGTTGTFGITAGTSFGQFGGTTTVRPDGPSGTQAFIWGYTSLDIGTAPEWILITNSNWIWPTGTPVGTPPDTPTAWQTTNEGTIAVFGSINHAGLAGAGNTQARLLQTQAIPEPSTYALIFGLGALGFLGFRRLRK